jgi:hypothetical protein
VREGRRIGVELLMLGGILVIAGAAVVVVGRGGDVQAEKPPAGTSSLLALARAERNSVAVLPFANLRRDPDNEYFSDGITDEILTTLANTGDLRVNPGWAANEEDCCLARRYVRFERVSPPWSPPNA